MEMLSDEAGIYKKYIYDIQKDIDINEFGSKSFWLHYLYKFNCRIPKSFFIRGLMLSDLDNANFIQEIKDTLLSFSDNGIYNIAIRSSSIEEDTFNESKAGHFNTIIGTFNETQVVENIKKILIDSRKLSDKPMGIILQSAIGCNSSGICFSSNPLNYRKDEIVISCIEGQGENLASGNKAGEDLVVYPEYLDEYKENDFLTRDSLKKLVKLSKDIEKNLRFPVDIEWGTSKDELYIFQCRPIASITSIKSGYYEINQLLDKALPYNIRNNEKVTIRQFSYENNIDISNAYVYLRNSSEDHDFDFIIPPKSEDCCGYSAVIIYPKMINDKVNRLFIGEKTKVNDLIKCYRYGVKSFPEYKNVQEGIHQLFSLTTNFWISAVILQEIYDPLYTGVMKETENGYLIEISKGHFVPKGIVDSSRYLIKNDKVVFKNEINQNMSYKIIEGHIISYRDDDYNTNFVSINEEIAVNISRYFKNILDDNKIIEFGILYKKANYKPYLIDIISDDKDDLRDDDIKRGIISHGKVVGALVNLEYNDDNKQFNMHYHDNVTHYNNNFTNSIFICEKPTIYLLSLLNKPNIGFIFKKGSVLCHLAVVLREKGIPAVLMNELELLDIDMNKSYQLDTSNKTLMIELN